MFDELTGLPDRRLMEDRLARGLARCRRSGDRLAVMFVALDGAPGDPVLVDLARRLAGGARAGGHRGPLRRRAVRGALRGGRRVGCPRRGRPAGRIPLEDVGASIGLALANGADDPGEPAANGRARDGQGPAGPAPWGRLAVLHASGGPGTLRAMDPIVSATDVHRRYGEGDAAVDALAGVSVGFDRSLHRDHGPVGLGQVDADAHARRARPAHLAARSRSTAPSSPASTTAT